MTSKHEIFKSLYWMSARLIYWTKEGISMEAKLTEKLFSLSFNFFFSSSISHLMLLILFLFDFLKDLKCNKFTLLCIAFNGNKVCDAKYKSLYFFLSYTSQKYQDWFHQTALCIGFQLFSPRRKRFNKKCVV